MLNDSYAETAYRWYLTFSNDALLETATYPHQHYLSTRTLFHTYNKQLQVPRISYLPLIIPEIRKNLLDLVLDENTSALLKESNLWLDCEREPLKW